MSDAPHLLMPHHQAPMPRKSWWTWFGLATVLALSFRAGYLFAHYVLGDAAVQRFHVESAALIWVGSGLVFRWIRRGDTTAQRVEPVRSSLGTWAIFCGLALALYWPARSAGFLSDDFILIQHAAAWDTGPVTREFFRPVPLMLWAVLLHSGAGALTLHLVNIFLHGTNAYLSTRVVGAWIPRRGWSLLAGCLVLVSPLAPEAVVWCSGVFDVLATFLLLAVVLIARQYEYDSSIRTRVSFFAIGALALLSKETAAVAPLLVLIDAWIRRTLPRRLGQDTAMLAGAILVVSVVRLVSRFGVMSPPIRRFLIQRALFASFGSLAVPWHEDVVRLSALMPLVSGLIVIALLTAFFLSRGGPGRGRALLAGATWIVAAVIPVFPILAIGLDLQASRYLYLAVVGWAALVVTAAASVSATRTWLTAVSHSLVIVLVALGLYGTRVHLRHWIEAAAVRDRVELAARSNPQMRACPEITVNRLPDSVRGAYLFRNGAREAFARDLGLRAMVTDDVGPCAFRWDEATGTFLLTVR
jgi:hypothetical protein